MSLHQVEKCFIKIKWCEFSQQNAGYQSKWNSFKFQKTRASAIKMSHSLGGNCCCKCHTYTADKLTIALTFPLTWTKQNFHKEDSKRPR